MKITINEYFNFLYDFNAGHFEGQRFGQAFINKFNLHDPEIFYLDDRKSADQLIVVRYVGTE